MDPSRKLWHSHPHFLHPVEGLLSNLTVQGIALRTAQAKLLDPALVVDHLPRDTTAKFKKEVARAKKYLLKNCTVGFGPQDILVIVEGVGEARDKYPDVFWKDIEGKSVYFRLICPPVRIIRGRACIAALRELQSDTSLEARMAVASKKFNVGLLVKMRQQDVPFTQTEISELERSVGADMSFRFPMTDFLRRNDLDDASTRRDQEGNYIV